MSVNIQQDNLPPLSTLTTLEVGGTADAYCLAQTEEEVIEAVDWAKTHHVCVYPLGGGSNVLCSDRGVRGLVLQYAGDFTYWRETAEEDIFEVEVSAGVKWSTFVQDAVDRGLSGVECLGGIPGQTGAAPIQNIGAYGQSLSDICVRVRVLDMKQNVIEWWSAERCQWSYRESHFKRHPRQYFILAVTLSLKAGGAPTITYPQLRDWLDQRYGQSSQEYSPSLSEVYRGVLELRASKSMIWTPTDPNRRSVGSFFLNPRLHRDEATQIKERRVRLGLTPPPMWFEGDQVKIPAAWLIEQSGCTKGYGIGKVGLSSKHSLALINRGGASATDLLEFSYHIQDKVREVFGVHLYPEPDIWGIPNRTSGE